MSDQRKRRNNNGQVNLFRPSDCKNWFIRYTFNGKQRRENTGTADQDEARQFAAQVAAMCGLASSEKLESKRRLLAMLEKMIAEIPELRDEAASRLALGELPTVRALFDAELAEMRKPTPLTRAKPPTDGTIKRIKGVFDEWLAYLNTLPVPMADATIDRITPETVRGFLADMQRQGAAGKTVKFAHARLRAVFGRAVATGRLASNPATAQKLNPQTGKLGIDDATNRRPFNLQQVAAVMEAAEAAKTPWLHLSATLALFTGQRAGDLCRMTWADVKDLDGELPRIVLQQAKRGTALVIPIAEPLRAVLQAIPNDKRAGHLLPDDVCVAYCAGRKRMFQRPWRDLLDTLDLAGMEELPVQASIKPTGDRGRTRNAWVFHSWRHTTATYLSGPDAHYLLGHRKDDERHLGTTQVYRHEDLRRLKRALDAIPIAEPQNVIELKPAANQ